jgi:hypothetical protein
MRSSLLTLSGDTSLTSQAYVSGFFFPTQLVPLHVGMLVGLAIYNGHILEFRFPMLIYRKLMGHRPAMRRGCTR